MDANGIAVLSFGAIFGVASLLAPASAGATPIHASVTAAAPAGFTPGLKAIHVNPINGKCKTSFTKEIVPKTQRLTFQRVNGTKFTKTVKKGAVVCTYKNAAGKVTSGKFSADGTLTALPVGFPKNPTVDDIAALGLTVDSKVASNIKINGPAKADTIPMKLVQSVTPTLISWTPTGGGNGTAVVEWTLTGGQGLLNMGDAPHTRDNLGGDRFLTLSPTVPTRVTVTMRQEAGQGPMRFMPELSNNAGQDKLPHSAMGSGWDVIEFNTNYGQWAVNAQGNSMMNDDSTINISPSGELIRR